MTLSYPVFSNGDIRLRVWFNDGVIGFQQFSPDQRLAELEAKDKEREARLEQFIPAAPKGGSAKVAVKNVNAQ